MTCPVCHQQKAVIHQLYGVLPCSDCQNRRQVNKGPDVQVEFTSDSIRQQRKKYAKDILQPFRSGEPSREFLEAFPNKAKRYFKDTKKAKKVWKDL